MRPHLLLLPLLSCVAFVASAAAQPTTDRGASILIFPKVAADADADTLVQLTSASESRVSAWCSYVDGRDGWQATGFTVSLGSEQPLHWSATRGRMPADDSDPNTVPPAPDGFRGELLCVEVDGSGAPFSGNHLLGQVTLLALADGGAVTWPAVGLRAGGFVDGDDVLCLGDASSDVCFLGEYDACPAAWILAHPAEGAPDAQLGDGATLATRVTIVPCQQNIRDNAAESTAIEIAVTTDLGQQFSGVEFVSCWVDLALAEVNSGLFDRAMLGSDVVATRFTPAIGAGSFVLAAELERRMGETVVSRTALPVHHEGVASAADAILLPAVRP